MDLILIKTYLDAINKQYFEEEIVVSEKLVKILLELYKGKQKDTKFRYSSSFLKWYKSLTKQDPLTEFVLYIVWKTVEFTRYLHDHPMYLLTLNAFKQDAIKLIKLVEETDMKRSMMSKFNIYKRSLETVNPSTVFMTLVYNTELQGLIQDYNMLPFHKFIVKEFKNGNVFLVRDHSLYIKRGEQFYSLKDHGGMYYFLRLFKFLETLDARNYI